MQTRHPWAEVLDEIARHNLEGQSKTAGGKVLDERLSKSKPASIACEYSIEIHSIFPLSKGDFDVEVQIAGKVLTQRLKSKANAVLGRNSEHSGSARFRVDSWSAGQSADLLVYERKLIGRSILATCSLEFPGTSNVYNRTVNLQNGAKEWSNVNAQLSIFCELQQTHRKVQGPSAEGKELTQQHRWSRKSN